MVLKEGFSGGLGVVGGAEGAGGREEGEGKDEMGADFPIVFVPIEIPLCDGVLGSTANEYL